MAGIRSVVQLVISAVDRGVESTLGRITKSLSGLKGLAVAASAALAGFFVTKFFSDAATSAQTLEEELGRLNGVIEATGGAAGVSAADIDKFARELDEATLGSASAIRQAAAVLLTFKSIAGETFFDTLTLAQDMADVFKQDVTSSATQLGKALEDPIKGISALSRVGVTFTETEKAKIKALVQSNRLLEAQGIILDTLRGQVGGAAQAAGVGLAGAIDLVGKRFTDLKEAIGKAIIPAANGFFNALAENLGAINTKITEFASSGKLAELAEAVAGVFKDGAAAVKDFILSVDLSSVTATVQAFGADVRAALKDIGGQIEALTGFATTAGNAIKLVFNSITAGFNAIAAGITRLSAGVNDALGFITGGLEKIGLVSASVPQNFQKSADKLRDISGFLVGEIVRDSDDIKAAWNGITGAAEDTAAKTETAAAKIVDAVEDITDPIERLNEGLGLSADQLDELTKRTNDAKLLGKVEELPKAFDKTTAAVSAANESLGLRQSELDALGITETEEIARVQQLADNMEAERLAREGAARATREQAAATEQRAAAAETEAAAAEKVAKAQEAAERRAGAAAFVAGQLNNAIGYLKGFSEAAVAAFTAAYNGTGRAVEGLDALDQALADNAARLAEIDTAYRHSDGFAQWANGVAAHALNIGKAFLVQTQQARDLVDNIDRLTSDSTDLSAAQLSRLRVLARTNVDTFNLLDGAGLDHLHGAIEQANDKLRELQDEALKAKDKLTGIGERLQDELDRIRGDTEAIERRAFERRLAEIKQLAETGGANARREAQEAERLAEQIHQANLRRIRDEQKARAEGDRERPDNVTPLRPNGNGGGGNRGGGASGGGIVIERGAFSFSGLDDKSLDEAARGLEKRLDRFLRLRQ